MKRLLSVLLVFPFLLICVIPSVSAVEVGNFGSINLLDYGYFNAYDWLDEISFSGHTVRYWGDNPYFVVEFANPGLDSIGNYSFLVHTDCNQFYLGMSAAYMERTPFDQVYLVRGSELETYYSNPENIAINISIDGGSFIEFINFYVSADFQSVSSVGVAGYNLTTQGYFETSPGEYWENEYYIPNGVPYESIRFQFTPVADQGTYEYFDLHLGFSGVYISSINVLQGDKPLDYVLTSCYYDANGTLITKSGNGLNDVLSETVGDFWLSIRVRCPDSALIDGIPYIFIDCGTQNGNQSLQYGLTIFPAYVSITPSASNGLFMWLSRIWGSVESWFSTLYDLISESVGVWDDGGGMEADSDRAELENEFTNIEDQMGQLEKPDISDDTLNPDIIVPSHDVVLATAPLTAVMNNGTIKDVFMLAMIFIFAGYIIYGKR